MKAIIRRHPGFRVSTIKLAATALLGLILFGAASSAVLASSHSLNVTPGSSTAGSSVQLTGSGWTFNVNPQYVIFWDAEGGTSLGNFSPNGNGFWSQSVNIPAGAAPGDHVIIACEGYNTEFKVCRSVKFTVLVSATATSIPPTRIPPTRTPTAAPTVTPIPSPTPPPSVCGDLGLGPDAVVIDFESISDHQLVRDQFEAEHGLRFESAYGIFPVVRAHSGSKAIKSIGSDEFGSILLPIRIQFRQPLQAVGMFVGLDSVVYARRSVTATLTAFGYRAGGSVIVPLGSSSVTFPAVPTDIQHCLKVEAAEGELIVQAVVEYIDAEGLSTFEPRLIDDLTLLYADSPAPEDLPPVVQILSPAPGQEFSGGDIDLRIVVQEDRGLRRLIYQVPGGGYREIGFSADPSNPTRYTSTVRMGAAALPAYRDSTFEVYAYDLAGQEGSSRVQVRYSPPATRDIQVVNVEVVQVIQCIGNPRCRTNSVPLISGKPTMVRVYVRMIPGTGETLNAAISGRMCRGNVTACDIVIYPSFNTLVPDNDPDPVAADRDSLDKTLNFMLPMDWVRSTGNLEFTVFVNYNQTDMDECCLENNSVAIRLNLEAARVIKVAPVRVETGGISPALNERWNMVDWFARVFPVARIQVTHPGASGRILVDSPLVVPSLSNRSGGGCGEDWNRMMSMLDGWRILNRAVTGDGTHYIGMVSTAVDTGGILGCGAIPGLTASSIVTPGQRFGGQVAAQELAHNYGLNHAPGCGADGLDPRYPVGDGTLDEWGLDVGRLQLYPPTSTFDYMGYCGGEDNTWTSIYTYRNMIGVLPKDFSFVPGLRLASPPAQTSQTSYLVGGGVIAGTSLELTTRFFRQDLEPGFDDEQPVGPYTVSLLDAGGALLYERNFGLRRLSNSDDPETGMFFLALPDLAETRTIVFGLGQQELSRTQASQNPPLVRLLSPRGGESWGQRGTQTVRWEASDPDGDALFFTLQVSGDGGASWLTLATELTGIDQYDLETGNFGGGLVTMRILASDGFFTSEDRTDGAVSIAPKSPDVFIGLPVDGASIPFGWPVVLRGFASDLEDGALTREDDFVWVSSLDGEIGRGTDLFTQSLRPGTHELTLSVRDSTGEVGTARVSVTILEPPAGPPAPEPPAETPPSDPAPFGGSLPFILGGLAIVLLLGAGTAFLLRRLRKS